MKRIVAIVLILALIFVMGCSREAPVTPAARPAPTVTPSDAPVAADTADLDEDVDLSGLDDLEAEMDFEDLDTLDEELNFEI